MRDSSLYAESQHHILNYENFSPICPYCQRRNIFNRVDDLKTVRPISHKVVKCQLSDCGKTFQINSDLASERHKYLIMDCYELMNTKRYMYCILNLCQAFESYFSLFFRVKLIFETFKKGIFTSDDDLNMFLTNLQNELKNYSYIKLRNAFFNYFIDIPQINTKEDLSNQISIFPKSKFSKTPPKKLLLSIQPPALSEKFLLLYDFDINEIRNQVVHGNAYRPGREIVENYLNHSRMILFGIDRHIKLNGEINNYLPAFNF